MKASPNTDNELFIVVEFIKFVVLDTNNDDNNVVVLFNTILLFINKFEFILVLP